jgi:hypothetical protein
VPSSASSKVCVWSRVRPPRAIRAVRELPVPMTINSVTSARHSTMHLFAPSDALRPKSACMERASVEQTLSARFPICHVWRYEQFYQGDTPPTVMTIASACHGLVPTALHGFHRKCWTGSLYSLSLCTKTGEWAAYNARIHA